jgi:alkylation response protein AidB-like acyl-CoA dehydrogenase
MNFDWTELQQKLRDDVAALLDDNTRAALQDLETAQADEIRETVVGFLGRLAPTGYLSVATGEAGLGEAVRLVAGQEVVAEASGALFLAVEASTRLFASLVASHASGATQTTLLGQLESGSLLGAVGLSAGDSEDSENVGGVQARRKGDKILLTGTKAFVTNGPMADWIAVSADLDGATVVGLVCADSPGLVRGPRLDTLGFRGLAVCAIELDQCELDADHVLGLDDGAQGGPQGGPQGGLDLVPLRRLEDLILCVASVGLMHRSLEAAKAHAQTHRRGGKPLMGYQEIRFKLAEMLTLHQTSQLYAYRAAWLLTEMDGPDGADAAAVVRAAKVFTAEAAEQVSAAAAQILAGQGFVSGNPVEQAYRDAKYFGLAGTTNEVARMAIADELLEKNPL